MWNNIFRLFLFLIISCGCYAKAIKPSSSDKPNTLILSYEKNWSPYIYKDELGQLRGQDAELLSHILAKMNYKLELFPIPENRLKAEINHGDMDVAIAAFKNEQRQEHNWFTLPYRSEKTVIAYLDTRHHEFRDKDIYSLMQGEYSLGMNTGAWYGQKFEQKIKHEHKLQCFHIEGVNRRLKMLAVGRVDLIIGDHLALASAATELGLTNIRFGQIPVFEDAIHFIFSKKSVDKKFIQTFNLLLQQTLEANS